MPLLRRNAGRLLLVWLGALISSTATILITEPLPVEWLPPACSCFCSAFLLAFFISLALARGDLVEGAPLRFHPHVGVAGKHGARDVAGDAHNNFSAGRWDSH